jgi:pilus assembly protein CpaB
MRISALITAVLGLAVAGGSAFMARDFLEAQNQAGQVTEEAQLVDVIVAAQDIAFGQAIDAQSLTTISWPAQAVPAGTFTKYSTLLPEDGREPRRARKSMSQGELLLANKVSDFGEKVTIVQTLGPNHRAMAINVSAGTAVGGFVTPGDYVDVVLTQGAGAELRAVTIMQNIRVIGVDQDSNEQSDMPRVTRTVTVEVTPEQGQKMALAQQAGRLSLTLRNLATTEDKPLESIRLSDVMQDLSPVPDDAPVRTIKVRRGTEVQEEETR